MAIGTALAIGLGTAALSAGGSALAASKNSKAINKATDAQTESNAASVALQRDIYGQNKATLSPFVDRGNQAGGALNALLGLGGQQQPVQQQPTAQPNALAQFRGGPGVADYYGAGDGSVFTGNYGVNGYDQASWLPEMIGPVGGFAGGSYGFDGRQVTPTVQQQAGQPGMTMQGANDAFKNYIANSDYAFQFGEGSNAVNSGYAGAGTLQSGAAMKGLEDYRQNLQSGYRNEYMGYLGQQQGVGLSAAGAQAGVGLNYANNVSNLNSQNANALSNAAVAKANNSNALIGGITGAIGGVLGGLGR